MVVNMDIPSSSQFRLQWFTTTVGFLDGILLGGSDEVEPENVENVQLRKDDFAWADTVNLYECAQYWNTILYRNIRPASFNTYCEV